MKKIGIGFQVILYSLYIYLGTICFMAIIILLTFLISGVIQGSKLTLGEKFFIFFLGILMFLASLYLMSWGEELLKKAKKAFNSS